MKHKTIQHAGRKLFILLLLPSIVWAQTQRKTPRFVKTPVAETGCFVYVPQVDQANPFDMTLSPDSAKVYHGDFLFDSIHYEVITVCLKNMSLKNTEEKETLIKAYLDYLKPNFHISQSAGYGLGQHLAGQDQVSGILDYWTDEMQEDYVVKAWADETKLAVLLLHGPKPLPVLEVQQTFLNGFRFHP